MDRIDTKQAIEALRHVSKSGVEYWHASELMEPFGYAKWDNFVKVIQKAEMVCESTNSDPANHFLDAGKMVPIGSGAKRLRGDVIVSRYGAYLIAMNGSPRKRQIAVAQIYFAVQTKRQEDADRYLSDDSKRLELRDRVRNANRHLASAAKRAGVQSFPLFYDAGYRGLYGLRLKDIKERKGLKDSDDLLNFAGRAELAANEFKATQAEDVIKRDSIRGDLALRETHKRVGEQVRNAIRQIGGTMPENLQTEEHIKKIERKFNKRELPSDLGK